jgi:zinc protease
MADVLLNPTFPQDELDKWKTRQLTQLQQARASEQFLGLERQRAALYPDDGRKLIAPGAAEIKAITRDKLIAFYKANYRPGNSILGVSGDVKMASLTGMLDKALGGWEAGSAAEPKIATLQPIPDKKIYLVDRPNSVQTLLILTNRAISRTNPDYIAVQVMNRILGGGPAGRLFRNIREDKGYTYGASSSFTAMKYLAYFGASSSVRTDVTEPALQEFLNEFRDIREKPVPAEELDDAKRAIVANFALGLERQSFVLNQILIQKEYGLPADYWDTYPAKVMAVTAEDVQKVAGRYVPLDNVQVVAVGDAAKIRSLLAKFGPVEEYTAEGVKAAGSGGGQ